MPRSKRDRVIRILASGYLHLFKSLFKVSIKELKTVVGLTVALIPLISQQALLTHLPLSCLPSTAVKRLREAANSNDIDTGVYDEEMSYLWCGLWWCGCLQAVGSFCC